MSEKKIAALMKKVKKFREKTKFYEALALLDKVLEISPDFLNALDMKSQILFILARHEEAFQPAFRLNQLKLQQQGIIPSDINSPDAWIKEAINLINIGKNDLAILCLSQASFKSPIVHREGLKNMAFHTNAKIYYFTAVVHFNLGIRYDTAMSLFEIANKLDPTLTIPNREMQVYKDYLENRSGVGVKMDTPINETNLRALFPSKSKILVSTTAKAVVRVQVMEGTKQVVRTYTWYPHLLISDYGIAFIGAKPVCQSSAYFVSWIFVNSRRTRMAHYLTVSSKAGDFKHEINFDLYNAYKNLEGLNIKDLINWRFDEAREKTINNLQYLEILPPYKEYISYYENIPKSIYKFAIKYLKQSISK